jgi:hypothetical protein
MTFCQRKFSDNPESAITSNQIVEMKTSADEVNAATFYAVGRVIELSGLGDTGGSITIEIVKQQQVAHGRNSQVVLPA